MEDKVMSIRIPGVLVDKIEERRKETLQTYSSIILLALCDMLGVKREDVLTRRE